MARPQNEEYAAAVAEADEWEQVGNDFPPTHDFDEQGDLVGTYLGKITKEIKGEDRIFQQFDVDGVMTQAWGAAILNSQLERANAVGRRVKVIKTGKKIPVKNGGRANEFVVYVSKAALNQNAA